MSESKTGYLQETKKQKNLLLFEDQSCFLFPYNDFRSKENDDILFWFLFTLLYIFIIIISIGFVFIAVNCNQNLGSTLISPVTFYPGQFLKTQSYMLKLIPTGFLQLSQFYSNKQNIYWESKSNTTYNIYGLVCQFSNDGSLSIQNYQQQILWNMSSDQLGTHPAPYILNLSNTGVVFVRSVDGTEMYQFPFSSLE